MTVSLDPPERGADTWSAKARTNTLPLTDGEFHVDLYTLPDPLIKMLWDFASNRVDMNSLA